VFRPPPSKEENTAVTKQSAPKLWKHPSTFAMKALGSPWYTAMLRLQSTLIHGSVDFFSRQMQYRYVTVPMTTGSISSPMGLGSDSRPVSIELTGTKTYLADSQQFALGYALRLEDGLPGAYYLGTLCRGEDPDATHLNQFCHIECELLSRFQDGIDVANTYVVALIQEFKRKHLFKNEALAISTKHLDRLLTLYRNHSDSFLTITLKDALGLPTITKDMWYNIVEGEP
jgi:beta-aspartyl-peptidase (threonine type)